MFKKTTVAVSN